MSVPRCPRCGSTVGPSGCTVCGTSAATTGVSDASDHDVDLSDLDDPTEKFEPLNGSAATPSHAGPDLPAASAVFDRATEDLQHLKGLERRLALLVDGVTPLDKLAPSLGVNVLRARHLAAALLGRGAIKSAWGS